MHQYDNYSNVHNFFFHPFHRKEEQKAKTVFALVSNIFITVVTGGIWQIPFWIVNRLDCWNIKKLGKDKTPSVNKASTQTGVFTTPTGSNTKPSGVTEKSGGASMKKAGSDIVHPESVFGEADWEKFMGKKVGNVPNPPSDINDILEADCQIFPGKKVWQTHKLVLIPETVDNNPLTLQSLGELVKAPIAGKATEYLYIDFNTLESVPSHWILITKELIKGTQNTSYAEQEERIKKISEDTNIPPYTMPSARDMAVFLFMHYVSTEECLFDHEFSRCQDIGNTGYPVVVGNFAREGLRVNSYFPPNPHPAVGVAAALVWK